MFVNDASADLGEDSIRVSHEVFGSTTKTDLNPNGLVSDPSQSVPEDCFPNVCFAIHDFSEAFDKLVRNSSPAHTAGVRGLQQFYTCKRVLHVVQVVGVEYLNAIDINLPLKYP